MAMRMNSLKVVGTASVVALVVTGCSDSGATDNPEPVSSPVETTAEPTPTMESTEPAAPTPSSSTRPATDPSNATAVFVPPESLEPTPLAAEQTDQRLALDLVEELNKWFRSGVYGLMSWQSPDTPESEAANRELVQSITEDRAPTYVDALLVPEFDSLEHPGNKYMSTDDFKQIHAEVLSRIATGGVSMNGEPVPPTNTTYIVDDRVERLYTLQDEQEGKHQRTLRIPVERITEPEHPDVPSDMKSIVVTFERDGVIERVRDMQWG